MILIEFEDKWIMVEFVTFLKEAIAHEESVIALHIIVIVNFNTLWNILKCFHNKALSFIIIIPFSLLLLLVV